MDRGGRAEQLTLARAARVASGSLPAMGAPLPEGQFRDHAANERTLLAWIRTGIALMAFGFAIARFGLFLREVAQAGHLPERSIRGLGSAWFGVSFVILGLVTNAAATLRYVRVRNALQEQRVVSMNPVIVYVLGIGSVLVAAAMAAILARTLEE